MTHSLHRVLELTENDFKNDIVVMMMAAKNLNKNNSSQKKVEFLKSAMKFNPVNYGEGVKLHLPPTLNGKDEKFFTELLASINDDSTPVAVYDDPSKVAHLLKELKEKDLGLSVIVSGNVSLIEKLLKTPDISIKSYAIEHRVFKKGDQVGIYGNYYLLPSLEEVEIASMCGHGMIPYSLIQRVLFDLKLGRINVDEASRILERPCSCGIFNREKAKEILRKMI
ncbi:MAG: hypothetical protein QXZ59_06645 [Nitrososphaeria archaeon]